MDKYNEDEELLENDHGVPDPVEDSVDTEQAAEPVESGVDVSENAEPVANQGETVVARQNLDLVRDRTSKSPE